jgi:hypothetical protein
VDEGGGWARRRRRRRGDGGGVVRRGAPPLAPAVAPLPAPTHTPGRPSESAPIHQGRSARGGESAGVPPSHGPPRISRTAADEDAASFPPKKTNAPAPPLPSAPTPTRYTTSEAGAWQRARAQGEAPRWRQKGGRLTGHGAPHGFAVWGRPPLAPLPPLPPSHRQRRSRLVHVSTQTGVPRPPRGRAQHAGGRKRGRRVEPARGQRLGDEGGQEGLDRGLQVEAVHQGGGGREGRGGCGGLSGKKGREGECRPRESFVLTPPLLTPLSLSSLALHRAPPQRHTHKKGRSFEKREPLFAPVLT